MAHTTVWRYATRGLKGVKLDVVENARGDKMTSLSRIKMFLAGQKFEYVIPSGLGDKWSLHYSVIQSIGVKAIDLRKSEA